MSSPKQTKRRVFRILPFLVLKYRFLWAMFGRIASEIWLFDSKYSCNILVCQVWCCEKLTVFVLYNQSNLLLYPNKNSDWLNLACLVRVQKYARVISVFEGSKFVLKCIYKANKEISTMLRCVVKHLESS